MLNYFLLVFFIFRVQYVICDLKLIEIYGSVVGSSSQSTSREETSDDDCVSWCYTTDDCFLVYMDSRQTCMALTFSTSSLKNLSVERRNETGDGSLVYFKTTLPDDTCPSSLESIDLTYSPDSSIYSYTWTPTETGWSFPGCRDGWHLSIRSSDLSVCIKVFLLNSNQNEAEEFCKKQDSVLIGVQTVEESQWMKKTVQGLVFSNQFFWIDGIRNFTGREQYCNNFDYSDGLTTGNAALTSDGNALLSFES
ncbi:unnamed protein product [Caenorhabditis brenneri]